jgi:hypothetical protein
MWTTRVASARQVFLGNRQIFTDDRVELEKSFFKSVCAPNGTHKTTAPGRLQDVDQLVCGHLENRKTVRLLDVGISSGVTTLELLSCLESRGLQVSGLGVDICVRSFLWSFMGIDILHDAKGNVLQVATPFFARGRPHDSVKSLPSKLLAFGMDLLDKVVVKNRLANSKRSQSLSLVSPRRWDRRDFEVVEHDVALSMPEWEDSFDFIRVANVLNRAYFTPSQILIMVQNLTSWLKKGGFLIVCSSRASDGSNHGSLYCKRKGLPPLGYVESLGDGYELDSLIHEMPCKNNE